MKGKNIFKLFFIFLCSINIFVLLNYPQKSYAVILFSENWDTGTPPACWPCKSWPNSCCSQTFHGWEGYNPGSCGVAEVSSNGVTTSKYHSSPNSFYQKRFSGQYDVCDITYNFSPPYPTKIYIRFYLYLTSNWTGFDNPTSADEMVHFLFTNSAQSQTGFRINLLDSLYFQPCGSGGPFMFFKCQDYSQGCAGGNPKGCYNLLDHLNEWLSVEFMMDAVNDKFSVWINGDVKIDNQSVPMTQTNFTKIIISGYNSYSRDYTADFYIDDIVVADSYLGPDGSSGNTPPPSDGNPPPNNSGGDSSSSGGSGCGFVKDSNGKGQEAKGEGLTFAITFIVAMTIFYLIKWSRIRQRFLP